MLRGYVLSGKIIEHIEIGGLMDGGPMALSRIASTLLQYLVDQHFETANPLGTVWFDIPEIKQRGISSLFEICVAKQELIDSGYIRVEPPTTEDDDYFYCLVTDRDKAA